MLTKELRKKTVPSAIISIAACISGRSWKRKTANNVVPLKFPCNCLRAVATFPGSSDARFIAAIASILQELIAGDEQILVE